MKVKKLLVIFTIIIVAYLACSNLVYMSFVNEYKKNQNEVLNAILYKVTEKYPDITQDELMSILNSNEFFEPNVLENYGINLNDDFVILKNHENARTYFVINNCVICAMIIAIVLLWISYYKGEQKRITDVTRCLERINNRDYGIDIEDNVEDELSILKNELYKTAIMLKEHAENSVKDKKNIKVSLEDISHQLKTPLTSINILLDNILDNPEIPNEVMLDFIKDIKKEVVKINFLIGNLLKLSRFDVNAVHMVNDANNLKDIIEMSVKNVAVLCDLKGVRIECNAKNIVLNCDFNWQVEALTNIIKNCVEHSFEGGVVTINTSENKIYTLVEIKDNGCGIAREDLPHIFDRFYRGKNSDKESVGIGLALAKSIIEKSGGKIDVKSSLGEYTWFEIRYFK